MRHFLIAAALLGCGGPSTSYQPMRGPSGAAGYFIQCQRNTMGCYQAASDLCPGGYRIVSSAAGMERNEQAQALENMSAEMQDRRAKNYAVERYDLLVECKDELTAASSSAETPPPGDCMLAGGSCAGATCCDGMACVAGVCGG